MSSGVGAVMTASLERAPWGWALLGTVVLALIKAWPVLRKLGIDENAGIRSEYVSEIKSLREEVHNLRTENDGLRREIRELHDLLSGIRRQSLADQAAAIRNIPAVSEAVSEAAVRAVRAAGDAELIDRIDRADRDKGDGK